MFCHIVDACLVEVDSSVCYVGGSGYVQLTMSLDIITDSLSDDANELYL